MEGRLDTVMVRVEERLDTTLTKIKALINGITLQYNEVRNQMNSRDTGNQ